MEAPATRDPQPGEPLLSVVVTSRNDNHGDSLLRRMQTFVNALVAQCRRHRLAAELLIVEWNPPADRPPRKEALRWPEELGPCAVRIVQVPAEVHARFRHSERAKESPVFDAWFAEHDIPVRHLPEAMYHEGAGDALFCGDALFAGYRIRSDVRGHQWLGHTLGVRVLPLELVNPHFYHLDTCFCPLAPGLSIWYPPAFDDYGRRVIESHVPTLIPAADEEANRFGCNAVVVGKTVVLNAGCARLAASLTEHGYEALSTPLDEFIKAGGSAKCLTLRLDGEEAANWKTG